MDRGIEGTRPEEGVVPTDGSVPRLLARSVQRRLEWLVERSGETGLEHFIPELRRVQQSAAAGTLRHRTRHVPPTRGLQYASRALSLAWEEADVWDRPEHAYELVQTVRTAAGWAAWTEFYREDDWTRGFVHRFAGGTVVGPDAPWRDSRLVLDVFVYGPSIFYPPHAHPAEEVYLILGGEAEFQTGANAPFRPVPPGETRYHRSELPHAIRIGAEPVLGVVMYRGDLEGPLWHRPDMENPAQPKEYPGLVRPE